MKYKRFSPLQITPTGWLRRQLEIQADGLSGHLDQVWQDVRDSAWIGGDREGWERVPYWLDGFIPLAWLLQDEDKKRRAEKYIQAILDRQNEDGWICPCSKEERAEYDLWAVFLIGKVLAVYYEFTESEAVLSALYRAFRNLYDLLIAGEVKLQQWGQFRWFEALIPVTFLYERFPEEWLKELALFLQKKGTDYPSLKELWEEPFEEWTFETHIVNIAMMFKYEALTCELFGTSYTDQAEGLWQFLSERHGTVVGTLNGDECLAGTQNNRGFELCSVVELMYSFEILYSITGDNKWMERVEKLAFNALPATLSDDMWTHQYDQMVNQIACVAFPGKSFFGTNDNRSHLFGLEPNYGCCTANFNQGWPKLAMNVFQKDTDNDSNVIISLLLPCTLNTVIADKKVAIAVETEYPFRNQARIRVQAEELVRFCLQIRLPSWAEKPVIRQEVLDTQGIVTQEENVLLIDRSWDGEETILLSFDCTPHFVKRPHDLYTVSYGSLLFALPIPARYVMQEYTKDGVERKFPYCDYELLPEGSWNYGFADTALEVLETEGDEIPFSSKHPRLSIKASLSEIDWPHEERYRYVAAYKPVDTTALSEPCTIELIPYGCAKLRMTEMPFVKEKSK